MSKKVEIELISAGIRELLQSDEIRGYCEKLAHGVASRAGEGYEVDSMVGKTRANASIYAATKEANKDNLENNTLLKALGG